MLFMHPYHAEVYPEHISDIPFWYTSLVYHFIEMIPYDTVHMFIFIKLQSYREGAVYWELPTQCFSLQNTNNRRRLK